MSQVDWSVQMIKRYRTNKNADEVGIKRLHYWIVSLPREERMIPAKRHDTFRLYENLTKEYKRLSKLLTDARINRLIPFDWVIDEKNGPLIEMPLREEISAEVNYRVEDVGYIPYLEVEKIPCWEDFIDRIEVEADVSPPRFAHQTHRIVVAIEKATARHELIRLCKRYGADLLIFGGEFSVTRVGDVVKRAKGEGKPIALLYISDLDCAGWFMPTAFFRRMNEIYPRPDHTFFRVALTRDQTKEHGLPPAFDPDDKGYPEGQKNRFYKETGGRTCIELDALDEDVLVGLLEDELEKWAHIEEDDEEYNEKREEYEELASKMKEKLDLDLFDLKEEYESAADKFNGIVEEIQDFNREIHERSETAKWRKFDLINKVKKRVNSISGCSERRDKNGI